MYYALPLPPSFFGQTYCEFVWSEGVLRRSKRRQHLTLWHVNNLDSMEILTDWQTDRPTDIVVHREVILPKISIHKRTCRKGVNLLKWFTLWDTATRYSGCRHKSYSIISFHFVNHFSKKKIYSDSLFIQQTRVCMNIGFYILYLLHVYILFKNLR